MESKEFVSNIFNEQNNIWTPLSKWKCFSLFLFSFYGRQPFISEANEEEEGTKKDTRCGTWTPRLESDMLRSEPTTNPQIWVSHTLFYIQHLGGGKSPNWQVYRGRQWNASQEIERYWPTAQLLAAKGSAWLMFSFPPFPVRRFSDDPGSISLWGWPEDRKSTLEVNISIYSWSAGRVLGYLFRLVLISYEGYFMPSFCGVFKGSKKHKKHMSPHRKSFKLSGKK